MGMAGRETAILSQVHKSYLLSAGCIWAIVTAGCGGEVEKRNVAWDLESQHAIQRGENSTNTAVLARRMECGHFRGLSTCPRATLKRDHGNEGWTCRSQYLILWESKRERRACGRLLSIGWMRKAKRWGGTMPCQD